MNRTVAMINKYFDGRVPAYVRNVTAFDADLEQVVADHISEYHKQMEAVDYHVPWRPYGRLFHARTNTLMKLLLGCLPKQLIVRSS
ncbi:hypothetical protein [Streptococcus equi]|uniref:hypothetical protein n=1 Tax=Streptococcus equi TaxID=1336 RepID=UPI001E4C5CFE